MTTLRFKKGDFLAIGLVVLMVLILLVILTAGALPTDEIMVEIYQDGVLITELPLSVDREYVVVGEYENLVVIENGSVRICRSNCPGEDCVHTGEISDAGRCIVCLPNKTELRLSGEAELDAMAG